MLSPDDDDDAPDYDLGWWPEIVGIAGTAALLAFLIGYASGFM